MSYIEGSMQYFLTYYTFIRGWYSIALKYHRTLNGEFLHAVFWHRPRCRCRQKWIQACKAVSEVSKQLEFKHITYFLLHFVLNMLFYYHMMHFVLCLCYDVFYYFLCCCLGYSVHQQQQRVYMYFGCEGLLNKCFNRKTIM